jgi:hypothetical protein|tara:strand:+ start:4654 stop:5340 length:687 start_codon:yes stop_codon:yes gene_type:complete
MAQDTKHWFNKGETLWDYRRKASRWHFDPDILEESSELIKTNFVRFKGDWSEELKNTKFKETPPMDLSEPLQRLGIQEHINLNVDTRIEGVRATVDPTSHKIIYKIVSELGIADPYAQIIHQKPGEMFTLHMDVIACNPRSMDEANKDETNVRMFVALEDWCWGQYLLMGNFHWTNWKAGDTLWFRWQDLPHASANAGHKPRSMLKITGKKTKKFEELLEGQNKIINI